MNSIDVVGAVIIAATIGTIVGLLTITGFRYWETRNDQDDVY